MIYKINGESQEKMESIAVKEKISHWHQELDDISAQFFSTFGALGPGQLNFKPDVDTWSIAQNIDHLIVINSTYFPVFRELEQGENPTAFWGRLGFLADFFGRFVLNSVQPDRRKKTKTFSIWEPKQSGIGDRILIKFREHQKALKSHIEKLEPAIAQGAVISSPASRFIVYKLETAIEIILAHEKRHFEQASELFRQLQSSH